VGIVSGVSGTRVELPVLWFLPSVIVLWVSAQIGASLRRRWPPKDDEREDFVVVQAATLTLLGLISRSATDTCERPRHTDSSGGQDAASLKSFGYE
jgi:hypothetical protein